VHAFGISVVRNEVDVVRVSVLHHLWLGLERILVIDNGSSDGTGRVLADLARTHPVAWRRDESEFDQSGMLTTLAREAWRAGATWIVPFDADEFWWSRRRPFLDILATSTGAAIRAPVRNFIQRRGRTAPSARGLLSMTRRTAEPVQPAERCRDLVEARAIAFVEILYPPKIVSRASATLEIGPGNHGVGGLAGQVEDSAEIVCLHAPLRSRRTLEAKAEHGSRVESGGFPPADAWHVRRWLRLSREGALAREWDANSYARDHLDVYGTRRPVVFDPTLRDALRPLVAPRWSRWLSRCD
jgi:hypothetical protein